MEEKNNKRKIVILISIVVALLVLLIGITYAYFSARAVSTEQTVTTQNLGLEFDDSTAIINAQNISPILREEMLTKAAKKTFTITNTGGKSYVKISLEDVILPSALKRYDFMWSLYEGDKNVSNGSFEYAGDIVTLADYQVFDAPASLGGTDANSKTYNLYIWIEETNMDQNPMKGQSFSAKITANAITYYTNDESDFTFDASTGTITGYTGTKTDVVIPPTIDGVAVTTIGSSAFTNKGLTSVVIPNTVTTINDGNGKSAAFSRNQLTKVVIPNSVTYIGQNAFTNNKLTSITIPNSVTSIGNSSFGSNQLTSIVIPNNINSINSNVFYGNNLTSIIIPNGVTSIGEYTFDSNQLMNVVLPNSVISIAGGAFQNNKLTNITIPNGVTSIGLHAFNINELTNLVIPNNVNIISSSAFTNNPNLKQITVEKAQSDCAEFAEGWYDDTITTVIYQP